MDDGSDLAMDRTGRWALLLLLVAAGASLFWIVHECFTPFYDASLYVLTAKSLANGEGYRLLGENFGLRAPGFAAMLAPIIMAFGTDFLAMNIFVSITGLIALGLLFVYARPTLGVWITLALCALVWVNPCFRRYSNMVMSDLPGLAAFLGALLLERRARRASGRKHVFLLGAVIGLAIYLRAVYLFLLVAIAGAWLCEGSSGRRLGERSRRIGLLMVVVGALVAPWEIWKRVHPAPIPSETAATYSFLTGVFHVDPGDPNSPRWSVGELAERAVRRASQSLSALGSRLRFEKSAPVSFAFGLVLLLACAVVAFRRWDAGCIFALLNAAVLLLFNDWSFRLMLPIFVVGAIAFLHMILERTGRTKIAVSVAVVGLLTLGVIDHDLYRKSEWLAERHRSNVEMSRYVEENYPQDINVAACMGHTIAAYFDRPCYYVEKTMGRAGPRGVLDLFERRKISLFVHSGRDQNKMWGLGLANVLHGAKSVHRAGELSLFELSSTRPPLRVPREWKTIAKALEVALPGDRIEVAPGVYRECLDFGGKPVTLFSVAGPKHTTLIASRDAPTVRFGPDEGDGQAALRGFTIVGSSTASAAGPIVCDGGSPVIEHCLVEAGRGVTAGAIACLARGAPEIRHSRFLRCRGDRAGAIYCDPAVAPIVFRNRFIGNEGGAGAVWMSRGQVRANTFLRNIGTQAGALRVAGGLIVANVVALNRATEGGAGIAAPLEPSMALAVEHNTIVDNDAGGEIGAVAGFYGSASAFRNNILRNRGGVEFLAGRVNIAHCNVRNGAGGVGNIDLDPKFVRSDETDYHLRHDSPCRDAGIRGVQAGADQDNQPRMDGSPDIGADEVAPHLYVTGSTREGDETRVTMIGAPGQVVAWVYSVAGRVRVQPKVIPGWGDFYLHAPFALGGAGVLDESGAMTTRFEIPRGGIPVYALQAAIGGMLSKPWILAVR